MSRLQIFPPIITLYPNDRQDFVAQATPPPGMWLGVTNSGDIKSDFSLEVDAGQSSTGGFNGHRLMSGIGFVEWVVDNAFLPIASGGPGQWVFTGHCFTSSPALAYRVELNPASLVIKDENLNTLTTIVYSTLAGDVYRLEMSSGGWRLYGNGNLVHSRVNLGTPIIYPLEYSSSLTEPVANVSLSRIPAPRLIGDWKVHPSVTWTTPTHGAISTYSTAPATQYGNGTVPGIYTLTAQIEPAADATGVQKATALIEIAALDILGPSELTLQPGQKIRPKTNYDQAQNLLVAWTVASGGGSFAQDEYTAATAPGVSVLRATASVNNQVADIAVTVPAVITNTNNYTAAKPSEQIDFDTNILASSLPAIVGASVAVAGTGDLTVGLPGNLRENDIMLLFVETANEVVAAPSGWVAVADSPQGTGTPGDAAATRLSVFWKRAVLSETAPVITDPGDHVVAQIFAARSCIATGNPWDVTSGNTGSSSTSVSIPGDTTTVNNCLVVLAVSNGTDTATPQTSGYTNGDLSSLAEVDDFNSTQGNGGGFAVATGGKATAGTYGATTATLANASTQGRMSIALKPAVIAWSASIGSINSSTGVWTAPSLAGQTARITATNGTFTATLEVLVLEAFPFSDFILPMSWDRNLPALVSMSEDRSSRITREKARPFDSYPIRLTSRTLADSNAVDAFFDAQGFGKPFILEDKVRGIRKVGWFDSPIRHEARDECDIDLSFQFLEARI